MPVTVQVKPKKKVVIYDSRGKSIPIDCTISEDHTFTSTATMHEIEGGDSIADHVVKKPIQLTLTGLISADPIPEGETVTIDENPPGPTVWTGERLEKIGMGAFSGVAGMILGGGVVGGAATYTFSKYGGDLLQKVQQAENEKKRQQIAAHIADNGFSPIIKTAYDLFYAIYDQRLVVGIQTGLNYYENMVMLSLSLPRDKDTVRSLPFTASFQQVRMVSSETVTIPAMADRQTADRATPVASQGVKQTTTVSPETTGYYDRAVDWSANKLGVTVH